MARIDINSAVTGTGSVRSGNLKPGVWLGDFGTQGQIDAPEYVPTGSHELHTALGNGWEHQIVYGEHIRPGAFA